MENSPPGIHTMPSGAGAGAAVLLGIVGANAEFVEAGAAEVKRIGRDFHAGD